MLRGYRGILAAITGLILLGASPSHERQGGQNQQSSSASGSTGSPSALHKTNPADASTQPCDKGQDNRSSDLCAQWKAADAAQSGAYASWLFGYVGSVVGGLTLCAAIAAAFYARSAAIHTETSAKSFVETERAILHAIGGDVGEMTSDRRLCVAIEVCNRGRASGKVIEVGAKPRGDGIPANSQKRWTVIAPVMKYTLPSPRSTRRSGIAKLPARAP